MKFALSRADTVVLIAALVLLAFLYIRFWGDATRGEQVRVMVGGAEFRVVSLHKNQHLRIPGTLGVSELEIHAGKIRFVDSPCRGKQCIHTGWLALGGEVAACLPNRITVQVIGREPRFDAINF